MDRPTMTLADVTRSLDDVCVIEDPERTSPPHALLALRDLIDEEIEAAREGSPSTYLSPPADNTTMTFFFGAERGFTHLKLISNEPLDVVEWDYRDLEVALLLVHALVSRLIEVSSEDARRAELFRAEAAAGLTTSSSRQILYSRLPWVHRSITSKALCDMQMPSGEFAMGLRRTARHQACTVEYHRRSRTAEADNLANHIINLRAMRCIVEPGSIDPIELMRLVALDKEAK